MKPSVVGMRVGNHLELAAGIYCSSEAKLECGCIEAKRRWTGERQLVRRSLAKICRYIELSLYTIMVMQINYASQECHSVAATSSCSLDLVGSSSFKVSIEL